MAVQDDPERFDPRAQALLERLANGASVKDLESRELDLLNSTAVEEAQAPPPKREEAPAPTARSREVSAAPVLEEESSPETDLPPYWWL